MFTCLNVKEVDQNLHIAEDSVLLIVDCTIPQGTMWVWWWDPWKGGMIVKKKQTVAIHVGILATAIPKVQVQITQQLHIGVFHIDCTTITVRSITEACCRGRWKRANLYKTYSSYLARGSSQRWWIALRSFQTHFFPSAIPSPSQTTAFFSTDPPSSFKGTAIKTQTKAKKKKRQSVKLQISMTYGFV